MERPARPAVDHLKEVAWAVFMIDLVLLLLGLFLVPHLGAGLALGVFGVLMASVTLLIGGLALLNVGWVVLHERWERRSGRDRDPFA